MAELRQYLWLSKSTINDSKYYPLNLYCVITCCVMDIGLSVTIIIAHKINFNNYRKRINVENHSGQYKFFCCWLAYQYAAF